MVTDIITCLVKAKLKPIVAVIMAITNLTGGGSHTGTFEEMICSPTLTTGIRLELVYLSSVHILFSVTAFLGNALILIALHKESSLHPPSKLLYRSLATTDLCVGLAIHPLSATCWMSIVREDRSLCRYAFVAMFITAYELCMVSLLTSTAISVDRLLALLLGLRYRQAVTLKRAYIVVATFWVVSGVAALCYILDPRITIWYGHIGISFCLAISIFSYTKIFRGLRKHHNQVQNNVEHQQPSQPNVLNIARYRKAVNSALWVQLVLVICYLPYSVVSVITSLSRLNPSLFLVWTITATLVYVNSTLNPFLYCWKIEEVRQAVKQTIRQALCCPWT